MLTPEQLVEEEARRRKKRVCFTGHRPEKLRLSKEEVCVLLEAEIRRAIADGFTVFITGMARGVDLWAGQIVIRLKREFPEILLVCASVFPGEERRWSPEWRQCYHEVVAGSNYQTFLFPRYEENCFLGRDRWMVDHAARVIAVYTGGPGGTKYTIDYARAHGVEVRICGS